MPPKAEHIFDIIYNKRCKTCTNHTMRVHINKLVYKRMKHETDDGNEITYVYMLKEFDKFGCTAPSLPSFINHCEKHIQYYLEHETEIKEVWIQEYKERNKAPMIKISNEINQQNRDGSEEDAEINRLMHLIEEKELKIGEAFPITGYNSFTGFNGPKLTWDQWTRKFITIKVKHGNQIIRKPMVLAKHQLDILELMDEESAEGIMLLIARNHRKSTTLEIYGLRYLCDQQARILYLSGSKDEVIRYTENVRSAITGNPRLLYYYGYLPSETRSNSQKGLYLRSLVNGLIVEDFDKDAHLSYATAPKSNSGSSKLGAHPDIIMMDDIQGEEVEMYDNIKRKHETWFDRNIMPMRNAGTRLIIAGTRKADDDIYDYIMRKDMLFAIQRPAILEFPNDGQEEPMDDVLNGWSYYYEDRSRTIGGETITNTFLKGIENLKGGKVFWDEFRMENWDTRPIQYRKANGEFNKTLMSLQELLLEKGMLEAKPEQGGFSFSAEYQLNPQDKKGKHFDVQKVQYFDFDKWTRIIRNKDILKYTWIDVGYTLKSNERKKERKGVKSGKTAFATLCRIEGDEPGFIPSDKGVYVLDVRSGNYYIQSPDPEKSLISEMLKVYESYQPQIFCFEDNFFGQFVRLNMQMFDEYHLPVEGKTNTLDKDMRISNGINALLSQPEEIGGLYLCKMANGFNTILKQITNFPAGKKDELDAVESCHRLLIKSGDTMTVIGDIFAREERLTIGCQICVYYNPEKETCSNHDNMKVDEILSCPLRITSHKSQNNKPSTKNPIQFNMTNPIQNVMRSYRNNKRW